MDQNKLIMSSYKKTLKKWFGFNEFRDKQLEIIKALVEDKKDVVAIMFTGAGKSICFQFPAVHLNKTVLVISPLISLMNDQKLKMEALKIPTCCLNSTVQYKNSLKNEILNNEYRIILTTPEYLITQEDFIRELASTEILCLVAIDEAHVSSTWAQDFRTSYTQLGCLKAWIPDIPLIALTATATQQVQNDIVKVLELNNPLIIKTTFDRPNLNIKVMPKSDSAIIDILSVIKANETTIIYCQTRVMTDEIADELNKHKIKSKSYHAGMSSSDRTKVHESFSEGKLKCITATISFGMGIDCTVRKVIHYGPSKDLESYYQEIGRAGRDSLPSECILFYSLADFNTVNYFTNQIKDPVYRSHMISLSLIMKSYLYSSDCRRAFILAYFGETYDKENCGNCDNCLNVQNIIKYDFAKETSLLFGVMNLTGNCYGGSMLVNILRGSGSKKLKPHFKQSDLFNAGKYRSDGWWKIFISLLINSAYIKENSITGGHGFTLAMTKKASEWLGKYKVNKATTMIMNVPPPLKELMPALTSTIKLQSKNPKLSCMEMDDLIEQANQQDKEVQLSKTKKSGTLDKTFDLFHNKGKTIKQIAIEQELTVQTIEDHVVKLYKMGKPINLIKVGLTNEIHNKISGVIKKVGGVKTLGPIKNCLPGVSYFLIKMSIAKLEKDQEQNKAATMLKSIKKANIVVDDEEDDKESWEKSDEDSNSEDISEEVIVVQPKKKIVKKVDTLIVNKPKGTVVGKTKQVITTKSKEVKKEVKKSNKKEEQNDEEYSFI
ncbi:MAG: DEAD/SNF2-like helicase [Barrevirus sp.]|uniref:DEAD/SNF2-like helicase n=1 Tax=Barrevirus sp. TaxID=2487763 RepID=A0A3G4ZQ33_9VIRU|nr:MAG: DEAD/SNF2-like helicase [Barrevirus sp.]